MTKTSQETHAGGSLRTMTKLRDRVRVEARDGQSERIATIDELAQEGLIRFREVPMYGRRGETVIRYFADYIPHCDDAAGTSSGWQISKMAYLSRTGQQEKITAEFT